MNPDQNPQPVPPPIVPEGPAPQPINSASTPGIVYVGFALAFLLPLAGLIVSIIARKKTTKESLPGEGFALAGVIIGGIFTAISAAFLGFMIWLIAAFGGFHGNGAESASKPITVQIEQIGGKKICSNGDSGYGIDNTTPWYQVYYKVPDSSGLTDRIKNIASENGYTLNTDQAAINQLKGLPDKNGDTFQSYGNEKFNPMSNYLKGNNGDKKLSITINRQTSVALYCNSGQYGSEQATSSGQAIVDLDLTLPETNR